MNTSALKVCKYGMQGYGLDWSQDMLSMILYPLDVLICEAGNIALIDNQGNSRNSEFGNTSKQHFRKFGLNNHNKQPREFVLTHMSMMYGSFREQECQFFVFIKNYTWANSKPLDRFASLCMPGLLVKSEKQTQLWQGWHPGSNHGIRRNIGS